MQSQDTSTHDYGKNLRKMIAKCRRFAIDDEASSDGEYAVFERKTGLGTVINSIESFEYLLLHGAAAWLNSAFNGVR